MSAKLSQKDLILISTYLDGKLSSAERANLEARLNREIDLKQAAEEMNYTRRLLRSLPKKKAPHNFSLTPEKVHLPVSQRIYLPVMSYVSAAAALAFVVLFASTTLLPNLAMKSAEPVMAPMAEMAQDSARSFETAATEAPVIIQWNADQENKATGIGGEYSGEDEATANAAPEELAPPAGMETSAATPTPGAEAFAPAAATPTEEPMMLSAAEATEVNPSDLILGLPEPGTEGTILTQEIGTTSAKQAGTPPATIWMIALGVLALLSGGIAIFLRKR